MKTKIISLFALSLVVFTLVSYNYSDENDNDDKFIVVLDAGHGGKDPGKPSQYGFKEKDIALKIALEVGRQLEKNPDIKVIYTRTTDVFIELKDRPKIANKANADLFVSIHCNAHHTQASGTETYVLDVGNTNRNFEVAKAENEVIFLEEDYQKHYKGFNPNSPESLIGVTLAQEEYTDQSILLASLIEENFVNLLNRKSRGVKQASLWVIHQTSMPSVLIETGFVTNKEEGEYLNSETGQAGISRAIVKAILDYKSTLDGNVSDLVSAVTRKQKETPIDTKPVVTNKTKEVVNLSTNTDVIKINENPVDTSKLKNVTTKKTDDVKAVTSSKDVVFKVQIAASNKELETRPSNFKGLSNISRLKDGSMYKYFYGQTSYYDEVLKLLKEAKNKGYSSSFVVAFKEDKRIPLTDDLKTISK